MRFQKKQDINGELEECGVVAIVRLSSGEGVLEAAQAALRGGCRALEVTLSVPGATDYIAKLAKEIPDLLLGAGTVLHAGQVEPIVKAGAQFIVSPILNEEMIKECNRLGVPIAPGCQTPTEMQKAHDWGADFVKVFPAEHLGPRFIKNVLAPLPHLKIMPTGGVTVDNIGDWLRAGASVVGVGSALVDSKLIAAKNFDEIERRAQALSSGVTAART